MSTQNITSHGWSYSQGGMRHMVDGQTVTVEAGEWGGTPRSYHASTSVIVRVDAVPDHLNVPHVASVLMEHLRMAVYRRQLTPAEVRGCLNQAARSTGAVMAMTECRCG